MAIEIRNVRVFDGSAITGAASIFIDGGEIAAGPVEDAEIVDGGGGMLLPGLIDMHDHAKKREHLEASVCSD